MRIDLRHDLLAIIAIIVVAALVSFGVPMVHAAPAAKMKEPGCEQFAKVGMWDVYHCVDSNGFEFEANSAGMMIPAGK